MKRILIATCAAIVVATTGAVSASAGQFAAPANSGSGAIIRVDDNRYYDDGYYDRGDYNSQYQYQNRGYNDDWRYSDYDNRGIVSPRWIVRNLERSDYRYISRPVLSGRFYQVKAVNPNGKKVKLFIDAYTGQIVKVKG
jgi:peptidase YpeB-like protein